MRTPPEIRKQLLIIRDRNKLTMTVIAERARVERHDILAALNMRASEGALRKLDAFLDAPKLHERDRSQNLICHEMERLSNELWREFKFKTIHPMTFQKWSYDKQKRYYNMATWRGKGFLQRRILEQHSIVVKVPDGATYWQYKTRCLHRIRGEEAIRTGDRDSRRVPWPRPVREERPL